MSTQKKAKTGAPPSPSKESDTSAPWRAGPCNFAFSPIVDTSTFLLAGLKVSRRNSQDNADELSVIPSVSTEGDDELLHKACLAAHVLQRKGPGQVAVTVALTAKDIERPDFLSRVIRTLSASGASASAVEISFPETDFQERLVLQKCTLEALIRLGVKLAVRDFGQKSASLAIFQDWPVEHIYLSESFAAQLSRPLVAPHYPVAVIRAALAVAEVFELSVIACGVQNAQVMAHFRSLGCGLQQGPMFDFVGARSGELPSVLGHHRAADPEDLKTPKN